MSGVITKFVVTSMFMWMPPVAIMYGFYHQNFPGISHLSSSAQTLAGGFLAVISVNIVIGFYIYYAMKEAPRQERKPDAVRERKRLTLSWATCCMLYRRRVRPDTHTMSLEITILEEKKYRRYGAGYNRI
ncbi:uncharacterized protein [Aegilops tauschii subsp. strangulata]|uniref:uncharacterized protein n=1 Tax=Aegilops tauschii subsp. strangulata TaxID=200361 RepID=UPI003CC878BC